MMSPLGNLRDFGCKLLPEIAIRCINCSWDHKFIYPILSIANRIIHIILK